MAATQKKNIWFWGTDDGVHPNKVKGLIAASQGILIPNSLLYLSSSGTWKACNTADGSDGVQGMFTGVVDKSTAWPITAELAGNTEIYVTRISADDELAVYMETGGADTAATQAMVGDQYGMTISTTAGEVGYVSLAADNSNVVFRVVDIASNREDNAFTTSDSPGVAIVKLLQTQIELVKA